jgi:CTP synthase
VKLRILIVDDEIKSVEPLHAELKKLPDTDTKIVGFDGVDEAIDALQPHIIILDLAKGSPAEKDDPGLQIYERIWDKKFCPIVFYTAVPELLGDDPRLQHPFVKKEKKGSGSEERVIGHVRSFSGHVSALDAVNGEIRVALNRTLKEVAPRVFANVKGEVESQDMLTRMARRRVAATMDEKLSTGGPALKSWEHYLRPPIVTAHSLTGDIIRKRDSDPRDPTSYAVVLTPSCDLATGPKRRAKVKHVLVAHCQGVQRLLQELNPADRDNVEERKKRLRLILTQGHGHSCLPLPAFPEEFPPMVADFRDLGLVSLTDIGSGAPYIRIASVDNPFRELVAWAYVLNAARPGLPDRDFDSWVDEIVAALPAPERSA